MKLVSGWGIVLLGLLVTAPSALALVSTTWRSAPFIVLPGPAPEGEKTLKRWGDVLSQPVVTSRRQVQLEEDAVATTGFAIGIKRTIAKGEKLGGVELDDGWAYCGITSSATFSCYRDTDGDGRFDLYWSRVLVVGAALPIFKDAFGKPMALPAPVTYRKVDEPPKSTVHYSLSLVVNRERGDGPDRGYTVLLRGALFNDGANFGTPIEGSEPVRLGADGKGRVQYKGAVVDILGIDPDDTVHYRVLKAMPEQPVSIVYRETRRY